MSSHRESLISRLLPRNLSLLGSEDGENCPPAEISFLISRADSLQVTLPTGNNLDLPVPRSFPQRENLTRITSACLFQKWSLLRMTSIGWVHSSTEAGFGTNRLILWIDSQVEFDRFVRGSIHSPDVWLDYGDDEDAGVDGRNRNPPVESSVTMRVLWYDRIVLY